MSTDLPMGVYHDGQFVSSGSDVFNDTQVQMDISRSHDVQFVTVTIPNEILTDTVRALGEFGQLHIVDISSTSTGDASKTMFAYKKRVTDLADIEKKLRSFEDQIKQREIPIEIADFSTPLGMFGDRISDRHPDIIVGATEFVNEKESQLVNNIGFEKNVKEEIARRYELCRALELASAVVPSNATMSMMQQQAIHQQAASSSRNQNVYDNYMYQQQYQSAGGLDEDVESGDGGVDGALSSYIYGVIPVDNIQMFSRLVYRTSKGGNALTRFEFITDDIIDPATGVSMKKAVFCVATIGRQLYRRITKLCPLVNATIYPITNFDSVSISNEINRLEGEIQEQRQTLERTSGEIGDILRQLAEPQIIEGMSGPCLLHTWQQLLFIEKVMIDVYMKCAFHATLVVLGAWIPSAQADELVYNINSRSELGGGAKPVIEFNATPPKAEATPPTYIPTNKVTGPFQSVVDTYGIPRYKEYNPALIAIATFPFLFGVMFGDVGHGLIIVLVAAALIRFENKLEPTRKNKTMNEMLEMIYSSRYFLLMMGCMSVYVGFIYNDCMSIPINIFGRRFAYDAVAEEMKWDGSVYPFGMDPSWYHVKNSLKFFNSFKMKMAVILGVIHMTFGMVVSLWNHIYFKDHVSIVFEFIPRVLFLLSTFGYMITMIIIKWCISWPNPDKAPSLIQTMINMFLDIGGEIDPESRLFSFQSTFQVLLVLIAVVCIPWMFLPKPLIEYKKRKGEWKWMTLHSPVDDEVAQRNEETQSMIGGGYQSDSMPGTNDLLTSTAETINFTDDRRSTTTTSINYLDGSSQDTDGSDGEHAGHDGHSFSEMMVHQSIHTIEFILGAVSNTASYLRLWALSLAHAQLSEVFWNKMLAEYGYLQSNPIFVVVGSCVWALASIGVIVVMDGLECFLHCLRLHWVEFMNKHYVGDGIKFHFFSFDPSVNE